MKLDWFAAWRKKQSRPPSIGNVDTSMILIPDSRIESDDWKAKFNTQLVFHLYLTYTRATYVFRAPLRKIMAKNL